MNWRISSFKPKIMFAIGTLSEFTSLYAIEQRECVWLCSLQFRKFNFNFNLAIFIHAAYYNEIYADLHMNYSLWLFYARSAGCVIGVAVVRFIIENWLFIDTLIHLINIWLSTAMNGRGRIIRFAYQLCFSVTSQRTLQYA